MSSHHHFAKTGRLVALALLALGLAACGGDDGAQGPQGEAGPPLFLGPLKVAPEEVNPTITDVSVSSPMVVEFHVTNERGFAVPGIAEGTVQFTVSKLVPGSDGETNNWRSYIWAADEGTANAQPGTYTGGTLEDHGDGTYTYTFGDELGDISSKSNTDFEPSLTHRVGIELRDAIILGEEIPAGSNAVYDFRPSDGATSGIPQREIVKGESCQTCHGKDPFSFHGGPRKDVEYCVGCHQKGAVDVGEDSDIDFRVMIHKIHAATSDAQYCGFGCERFGSPPDDFSNVHYPQDVRNKQCTQCHDPADTATPQASNVHERPTAAVCASCHTGLALDTNADGEVVGLTNGNGNHSEGGPQPNANCANCHAAGGDISVANAHKIPEQIWAGRFEYNILEINDTIGDGTEGVGEGSTVQVKFSITDPTNSDAAYDIVSDPEFTGDASDPTADDDTSVNMKIAWPTSDYTNVSNDAGTDVTGDPPSQPASVVLADGSGSLPSGVSDNGDGTYTVNTGISVPSTTPPLGSGAITIEGHTSGDFDGDGTFDDSVPVKSVVDYFAINDSEAEPRRTVVDVEKCQDCHGESQGLAFHGSNRNDNTQVCVVCHNPNQTDLFMRGPAPDADDPDIDADGGDQDGEANGINADTPDQLEDRSIDFKYMIHAIHGAQVRDNTYTAYGFGVRPHSYTHGIPRPVNECQICHEDGTEELPLGSNVLATTLHSGATVTATQGGFGRNNGAQAFAGPDGTDDGSQSDPTDDHNASATAAVCASCHDDRAAAEHMSGLGNGFAEIPVHYLADDSDPLDPDSLVTSPDTQAAIDTALPVSGENCAVCHGPGSIADVATVHAVD